MAQVPLDSVPSVTPSTGVPRDYQDIQANPAQFGGLIAQGQEKLGAGEQQAGTDVSNIFQIRQTRFNEVAVDHGMNQLMTEGRNKTFGDPADPTQKGLYALHGEEALNAGRGAAQSIEDLRKQISDGLQNDAQRLEFDRQSRRFVDYKSSEIASHLNKESDSWAQATARAKTQNAALDAGNGWNNDELLMHSLQNGREGAIKELQAHLGTTTDPDTTRNAMAASDSSVIKSAVDGALAAGNVARASEIMGKQGVLMQPAMRETMTRQIDAALKHKQREYQDYSDDIYIMSLPGMGGSGADIKGAIHGQESSGRADAPTSPTGAVGGWQMQPATFQQYAKPGERIDKPADNEAAAGRYIDDLSRRFGGDPARVAVGYFSGPGNVAPPGSPTPWKQDLNDGRTSVSQYVTGIQARMAGGREAPAFPDESAVAKQIIRDNAGDPEAMHRRLSLAAQRMSVVRLATATDRADLLKSLPDLEASALAGNAVEVPEDRIRQLLPPAQAQDQIEKLGIATTAGQLFKGVQWGTPEDIKGIYQDLSKGLGPVSTLLKSKMRGALGPPGQADPGSDAASSEAYRLRSKQILASFMKQVELRDADIARDPALYAAQDPTVASAAMRLAQAQTDEDKAAATSAYVTATTTVQSHLGVAPENQHVMSVPQAQQQARALMSVDPSKADMGAQLAATAKSYGAAWPAAFGDLVTLGKLPGEYQMLAAMPDPAERTQYQRALAATAKKGGLAKLKEDVPSRAIQDIDHNLDDKIRPFVQSAQIPGLTNNVGLISNVRAAIKTYAYYDALSSDDGVQSLDRATDAVINSKYDFDGTMRVPKGMLPAARAVTGAITSGLKATDLQPLAADTMATNAGPGLSVEQRQAITLDAAQRGTWIPNEDDSGLLLAGQLRNGANILMTRADGSRIEVKFKGMTATPSTGAKQPMDWGTYNQ